MKRRFEIPPTIEVPVPLPAGPMSPWLRLALIDSRMNLKPEVFARKKWHHDFEIMLMIEGTAWIWCDCTKGCIDVHAGDVLFIPPNFVHAWCYLNETHLAVHFDLHAIPNINDWMTVELMKGRVARSPSDTMPVFCIKQDRSDEQHDVRIPMITRVKMPEVWRERLEPLIQVWQTHAGDSFSGQLIVQETIAWALDSLAHGRHGTEPLNPAVDPRMADLLRAMRDPRERVELERMSIAALARRTNMGIENFRKAFRIATGSHPAQYMVERRVEQAARMLIQSEAKVSDVARAVGYDDQYHFSRVFRRVTGLPPSHYRARYLSAKGPDSDE